MIPSPKVITTAKKLQILKPYVQYVDGKEDCIIIPIRRYFLEDLNLLRCIYFGLKDGKHRKQNERITYVLEDSENSNSMGDFSWREISLEDLESIW
jgi:hypothetical protein